MSDTIDPFAAAAHHKAGSEFWSNRCMVLQHAVITQQSRIAELEEQLAQRDDEIARLDGEREGAEA